MGMFSNWTWLISQPPGRSMKLARNIQVLPLLAFPVSPYLSKAWCLESRIFVSTCSGVVADDLLFAMPICHFGVRPSGRATWWHSQWFAALGDGYGLEDLHIEPGPCRTVALPQISMVGASFAFALVHHWATFLAFYLLLHFLWHHLPLLGSLEWSWWVGSTALWLWACGLLQSTAWCWQAGAWTERCGQHISPFVQKRPAWMSVQVQTQTISCCHTAARRTSWMLRAVAGSWKSKIFASPGGGPPVGHSRQCQVPSPCSIFPGTPRPGGLATPNGMDLRTSASQCQWGLGFAAATITNWDASGLSTWTLATDRWALQGYFSAPTTDAEAYRSPWYRTSCPQPYHEHCWTASSSPAHLPRLEWDRQFEPWRGNISLGSHVGHLHWPLSLGTDTGSFQSTPSQWTYHAWTFAWGTIPGFDNTSWQFPLPGASGTEHWGGQLPGRRQGQSLWCGLSHLETTQADHASSLIPE